MTEQPAYKSLKITLEVWKAITRISAHTGEPRTRVIERLVKAEEARLTSVGPVVGSETTDRTNR